MTRPDGTTALVLAALFGAALSGGWKENQRVTRYSHHDVLGWTASEFTVLPERQEVVLGADINLARCSAQETGCQKSCVVADTENWSCDHRNSYLWEAWHMSKGRLTHWQQGNTDDRTAIAEYDSWLTMCLLRGASLLNRWWSG